VRDRGQRNSRCSCCSPRACAPARRSAGDTGGLPDEVRRGVRRAQHPTSFAATGLFCTSTRTVEHFATAVHRGTSVSTAGEPTRVGLSTHRRGDQPSATGAVIVEATGPSYQKSRPLRGTARRNNTTVRKRKRSTTQRGFPSQVKDPLTHVPQDWTDCPHTLSPPTSPTYHLWPRGSFVHPRPRTSGHSGSSTPAPRPLKPSTPRSRRGKPARGPLLELSNAFPAAPRSASPSNGLQSPTSEGAQNMFGAADPAATAPKARRAARRERLGNFPNAGHALPTRRHCHRVTEFYARASLEMRLVDADAVVLQRPQDRPSVGVYFSRPHVDHFLSNLAALTGRSSRGPGREALRETSIAPSSGPSSGQRIFTPLSKTRCTGGRAGRGGMGTRDRSGDTRSAISARMHGPAGKKNRRAPSGKLLGRLPAPSPSTNTIDEHRRALPRRPHRARAVENQVP